MKVFILIVLLAVSVSAEFSLIVNGYGFQLQSYDPVADREALVGTFVDERDDHITMHLNGTGVWEGGYPIEWKMTSFGPFRFAMAHAEIGGSLEGAWIGIIPSNTVEGPPRWVFANGCQDPWEATGEGIYMQN